MDLKKRTIKAGSVALVSYSLSQVIRFAGNLITTRILAPELFGIMAVAITISTIINLFSDLGLTMNVVRSERGDDPSFLKTVFTVRSMQGFILFLVISLAGLGLYIADQHNLFPPDSTYAQDELPLAILIVALSAIMGGFKSIQIDLHVRKQEIVKVTLLELVAQIVSLLFIVGTALHSPTIYSLAFAPFISQSVTCVGSYLIFSREVFGFAWDKSALREIFHFGKWITGSTAITAISNNIDKAFFGYFMTAAQLGVYSIATLIFQALEAVYGKLNPSLFTAVSEVARTKPNDISQVYYKIRFFRDLIIALPACLLIANGDWIIDYVYDARYAEAGLFLQLMCIAHLIECFLFKSQVITALGNSKIQFQTSLARFLGLFVLVPIGYVTFDVYGVIVAHASRQLFSGWMLFKIFYDQKYVNWLKELRTLGIIGACLLLGLLVRILYFWLFGQ